MTAKNTGMFFKVFWLAGADQNNTCALNGKMTSGCRTNESAPNNNKIDNRHNIEL